MENNVNLIFAVVPDQVSLYKNLSELIEGSFVGELNTDSSNIVALVVDIYKVCLKYLGFRFFSLSIIINLFFFQTIEQKTIAKKVVLATEALPEGVQVKFYSKCQGYVEMFFLPSRCV
jgi:hypothetical protein